MALNYSLKQEERYICYVDSSYGDSYNSFISSRVLSRVCVVPFKTPKVAPISEEQQEAYDELDDLLDDGKPSSTIGWAVRQQSLLSKKEPVHQMKKLLHGSFNGRSRHNWTILTLCAQQVSMSHIVHNKTFKLYFHLKQLLTEAGYEEKVDELLDFVHSVGKQDHEQPSEGKDNSAMIILQTVEDLVLTASAQPTTKVTVQFLNVV